MFDVEQCKKDGWRCEVLQENGWRPAEYVGTTRDGEIIADCDFCGSIKTRLDYSRSVVRNLPKKDKPHRQTFAMTVPACWFKAGYVSDYSVAVPLIVNGEGHPIVDHSDAILEVLERIVDSPENAYRVIVDEIARIKQERGD